MSQVNMAEERRYRTARGAVAPLQDLMRLLTGDHALGWVDQIAVSAMAFLTLVLIGTEGDLAEVGIYAVCASVLALALASQESLVTRPYTIEVHRTTSSGLAAGSLAFSILLGLCISLVIVATAFFMSVQEFPAEATHAAWAVAIAAPLVLLREYLRRFAFAHFQIRRALALDLVVVGLNGALLIALTILGHLSAPTAVLATAVSCGIGGIASLVLQRKRFSGGSGQLGATVRRSWRSGKWLFASQMAMQIQGYGTHWVSLALAGAAATGGYAACLSIVSLANPILFGFFNIMIPKSARAFNAAGSSGLHRQTVRDALVLAGLMASFCVFLAVFGQTLLSLLFPGTDGYGLILLILGLASTAAAIGVPASTALASANQAHAVAAVTAASAILSLALVWWLLGAYGLIGAAVGILVAESLGSIWRWTAFLLMSNPARRVRPAVRSHAI